MKTKSTMPMTSLMRRDLKTFGNRIWGAFNSFWACPVALRVMRISMTQTITIPFTTMAVTIPLMMKTCLTTAGVSCERGWV